MILNPQFNLSVAPKGSSYHVSFDEIPGVFRYVVFRSKNLFDLSSKYEDIKEEIESFDPSIGFTTEAGVFIDNFEDFLDYLLGTYNFIDYIDINNYYTNDLGNDRYDQKYIISTFCIFVDKYDVPSGPIIGQKERMVCSTYTSQDTHLHKREPIISGDINTNNKSSRWSWSTDELKELTGISYTVSLWKENKLITIFDTIEDSFIFSEHAINEGDGNYELIVLTKNIFGSVSDPASYNFFLKSNIEEDFKVSIMAPNGAYTEVINSLTPTVKLLNFDSNYDYIFSFNDNELVYSYVNDNQLFRYDAVENAIFFTTSEELSVGRNIVTVKKIDNIGNSTGSSFKDPRGSVNTTFAPFLINPLLVETPTLILSQWLKDDEFLISWKASANIKSFEVFQSSSRVIREVNSFLIYKPVIQSGSNTLVRIYAIDHLGNRSLNPLIVNVNDIKTYINELLITSPDILDTDPEIDVDIFNFINNPRPTFEWFPTETDLSAFSSYQVSLDGSNWESLISNKYTFLDPIQDGEYTFRIKVIHSDNKEGSISTFNFSLITSKPSYPIFLEKTVNAIPSILSDTVIGWSPIDNIKGYEYNFNETLSDTRTQYLFTVDNSIDFGVNNEYNPGEDPDQDPDDPDDVEDFVPNITHKLDPGINTISVRSVDIYGNRSKVARLSFLILDENSLITEPLTESKYVPQVIDRNMESSGNPFKLFTLDKPLPTAFCTLIFKDPNGKILGSEIDYTLDEYTNERACEIDGLNILIIRWYNEPTPGYPIFIYEEEKYYLFNSRHFSISRLFFIPVFDKVTWSVSPDTKYSYFEYSLALRNSQYVSTELFYGTELLLKDKLPAGDYKFRVKGYDTFNNFLCDIEEVDFTISNSINIDEKYIQLSADYHDRFLHVIIYKDTNSFEIKGVVDSFQSDLIGFLEYKGAIEPTFTSYDSGTLLHLNNDYNFIFNEFT